MFHGTQATMVHSSTINANQKIKSNHANKFLSCSCCHPKGKGFIDKNEAYEKLFLNHCGYYNQQSILLANGNYEMKDGTLQHHYYCRCKIRTWKCQWRAQIWEKNNSFCVYVREHEPGHIHEVHQRPKSPDDQHGIHPSLMRLIAEYLRQPSKTAVLRMTTTDLLLYMGNRIDSNAVTNSRTVLICSVKTTSWST
jgi:hypothetical protein